MKTKTKQELHDLADKLADEHGCEIMPAAHGGQPDLAVQHMHQRDRSADLYRLSRCRKALFAAGVDTTRIGTAFPRFTPTESARHQLDSRRLAVEESRAERFASDPKGRREIGASATKTNDSECRCTAYYVIGIDRCALCGKKKVATL